MEMRKGQKNFTFYRRKTTNVVMLSVAFVSAILTIMPLVLVFFYKASHTR